MRKETPPRILPFTVTEASSMIPTHLRCSCSVKHSFSFSGRPHDNAVAEAFFASFKKEEAYRREYTSEENFRKSVVQYIKFYNKARPHQTLKYKTPQEIEDAYYAAI